MNLRWMRYETPKIASSHQRQNWIATTLALWACLVVQGHAQDDFTSSDSAIEEPPITASDRDHWAFRPLQRPSLPAWSPASKANHPIDTFILAQLELRDIDPVPAASRRVLVRRLFLDLTGLPPTPDELRQWLDDPRPDAIERLVDRLLASPQLGEHQAQSWLDLARFAETDGFEHDKIRAEAWRYRDWVIRAINQDIGYDRFISLQLAGDEIEPEDPQAKIATTFCLAGPDMPDINSQDERKNHLLNGIAANVGSVIMGLQIGCAQCHEHKFDPISHADFYRMRAIFEPAVNVKKNISVSLLEEVNPSPAKSHLRIRGDWDRLGPEVVPSFLRIVNSTDSHLQAVAESLPGETTRRRWALAKWLTQDQHPLTSRVIVNRTWQQHFGHGLSRSPSDFGYMGDAPTHPLLLDWLATELTKGDWSLKRLHRKIVCTDAYQRGSYPDLDMETDSLDLSDRLRQFKSAIEQDPRNLTLAYFPRQRLTGESLRDVMLKISGSLNAQQYGPSFRPPLPQEVRQDLLKGQWDVTPESNQHRRRSIYVFARRNLRLPLFDSFDRPSGNESCARRYESTTALQSLQLLNSDFSREISERLALRLKADAVSPESKVHLLFVLTVSRPPTPAEVQEVLSFVQSSGEEDLPERWKDVCLAMLNTNEFVYVD